MKLAALALAALVTFDVRQAADACSPAPTCADDICNDQVVAIIEATASAWDDQSYEVTFSIAGVYGAAPELSAGMTIRGTATQWGLGPADLQARYYLYLTRTEDQQLWTVHRFDPAAPYQDECLGPQPSAAAVADVALSPTCRATLDPGGRDGVDCPSGFGCSAGGGASPALALGFVALLVRRRRTKTISLPTL